MKKSSRNIALVRLLTTAGIGAIFVAPSAAQTPGKSPSAKHQVLLQQRQAAFSQSVQLYKGGQFAQGETLLLSVNLHNPGTPASAVEAGRRLYSMALHLREARFIPASQHAIAASIKQVEIAATLARAKQDPVAEGDAYEQLAAIYEHFVGDLTTAHVKMGDAARVNPASKRAARETERLKAANDHLKSVKPRA